MFATAQDKTARLPATRPAPGDRREDRRPPPAAAHRRPEVVTLRLADRLV